MAGGRLVGGAAAAARGPARLAGVEQRVGLERNLEALERLRAALDGADAGLAGTLDHSALGTRWVYDGLTDPVFVRMLAAVTMSGAGQAVGMVEVDGRWVVVPPTVRLSGGGITDRVPVDRFGRQADDDGWAVLRNDRFELRMARRPTEGGQPTIGLTATWPGLDEPVVLAEVRDLAAG